MKKIMLVAWLLMLCHIVSAFQPYNVNKPDFNNLATRYNFDTIVGLKGSVVTGSSTVTILAPCDTQSVILACSNATTEVVNAVVPRTNDCVVTMAAAVAATAEVSIFLLAR